MNPVVAFIIATLLVGLNACTTQAWYEGVKTGAEQNCRVQPESERDRCEARRNKASYEDYEKLRKGM